MTDWSDDIITRESRVVIHNSDEFAMSAVGRCWRANLGTQHTVALACTSAIIIKSLRWPSMLVVGRLTDRAPPDTLGSDDLWHYLRLLSSL